MENTNDTRLSIKAWRVNKGLRQTDLAVELGVTRKTVASWEQGKAYPKADKIDGICKVLGIGYDNIKWKA